MMLIRRRYQKVPYLYGSIHISNIFVTRLLFNSLFKCTSIMLLGLALFSPSAFALEKIVLQLKWSHAYQFVGYYAAKEMGYYESAGLDVDIKPLQAGQDVVTEVVSGRANYGTGTSGLLLARQEGAPVVVMATIFQHSPYVIIAKRFTNNQSIHDLSGKPILLRRLSDELLVYLKREKVNLKNLTDSSPGMDTVEKLIDGSVSAISGYISNEPYRLSQAKFPYDIYSPRSIGIDMYGDNLFTTSDELSKNGQRAERFRVASLQGWEYILSHPDEAAAIIQKYAPEETNKKILFERDKLNPLIRADLVPVGFMNQARWRHTASIYIEAGGLDPNFSLKGFIYDPNPKKDLSLLYIAFGCTLFVLLVVGGIGYYIFRLNRRLRETLSQVQHLAHHDTLTGLPNRALFADRLQRAILKARREKTLFALLYIDIDHFKSINDQYGHHAGDEVLKAACNRMMACIRDSDSLGRLGGDEFVVLLEDLGSAEDALEIAKKIQSAIALGVSVAGEPINTSISIGISIYPNDADSIEDLFKCADTAMYHSKMNGRNSIHLYTKTPQ
ncbi:GGDEF domain-containing protein [Polynucleobacter sp. MWH-Svant-W18]|uniref:GGDEF domain-containing protein n=1 Tax=Polynucleobacter sp. MWH-Svant-W18 TaxID=1855909 RepID=UPI001BFD445B|nr:GGDEF domain-containing protein [Polynucleobacter sp. MWH-Svant-W18]QWD77364.1 diguanylate cyclase [Polynucleobacter sp. MWH-Svant-W18]